MPTAPPAKRTNSRTTAWIANSFAANAQQRGDTTVLRRTSSGGLRRESGGLRQESGGLRQESGGLRQRRPSVDEDLEDTYRGNLAVRREFAPLTGHDRVVQDIRDLDLGAEEGSPGARHRHMRRLVDTVGAEKPLRRRPSAGLNAAGDAGAERKPGVRFARHEHHAPEQTDSAAVQPLSVDLPEDLFGSLVSKPPKVVPMEPMRPVSLELQDLNTDAELRRRDMHIAIASFCGLATMVASSIVTWQTNPPGRAWKDLDPSDAGQAICNILNWCTTGSTMLSLCLLARLYQLQLEKKRREWGQRMVAWQPRLTEAERNASYSFWASDLSLWWFLESFVHLVHPPPWMDGTGVYVSIRTKTIYSYFQLWMLLRLYLLGRLFHTRHPAYRQRFEILENDDDLRRMNFRVTWPLTMKLYLFRDTNASILVSMLILFLVFGFALFVIERVEQPLHFGELDIVLFHCFTTATTIGYGRVKAISKMGRLVTVLLGTYGQMVLTFFGAVITNMIEPTKEERIIQQYVESSAAEHAFRVSCALLIQAAWKTSARYRYKRGLMDLEERSEYEMRVERKRQEERRRREEESRRQAEDSGSTGDSAEAARSVHSAGSLGGSSSSPSRITGSRSDGASAFSGGERRKTLTGDHHEMMALLDHTRNIGTSGVRKEKGRRGDGRYVPRVTLQDTAGGDFGTNRRRGATTRRRLTQYQRDLQVVQRLKQKSEQAQEGPGGAFAGVFSRRGAEATGAVRAAAGDELPLRGVQRDDLPNDEYFTATLRKNSRFAPGHKSNMLFEALKRYRIRKRDLLQSKMESNDTVLDKELTECATQMIELDDFLRENEEDIELMRDRTLRQLEAIRAGIIARYGDANGRKAA